MFQRLRAFLTRTFSTSSSSNETATITVTHDGVVQGQVVVTLDASTPAPTGTAFFASDSLWRAPTPAGTALDPNSTAITNALLANRATAQGIATTLGVPIYIVGPDQPLVKVTVPNQTLQQALLKVPLPDNAVPGGTTDQRVAVYQPSTDLMWDFWKLTGGPGNWSASYGGRMVHTSTSPGYYRNVQTSSGEILEQPLWGGVACSFAMVGGVMTIAELEAGSIDHALCFAMGHTRQGEWAFPAQRTDGSLTTADSVPEGARFRLDPNLDLASLSMPSFTRMMAKAVQTYGMLCNNQTGGGVEFRCETPDQYIAANGYNPYNAGPHPLFGGNTPAQILNAFPWSHLQLVKMDLRSTADNTLYVESPPV